jgi:hypothetical protein
MGNDTDGNDYGYKLHIVYNALAAVSEKAYATINDSPEAITFSWEFTTTPIEMGTGLKPAACITIDSTKFTDDNKAYLTALEDVLYGTEADEPTLPEPSVIFEILRTGEKPAAG